MVKKKKRTIIRSTNIFKKKKPGYITIRDYDLSTISGLSPIESYENITILSATCIVTTLILCQLRSLRPDSSGAKLDQSPSFRYYKTKVILKDPGLALSISLASSLPDVITLIPDDEDELEYWLTSVMDTYMGNERKLENVTENNKVDFIHGRMSEILGTINAAPANNMKLLNLDSSVADWTIKDVLENLPEPLSKVKIGNIIECFKSYIGDENPPNFTEEPYTGTNSINGGSIIENEIWSGQNPTRDLTPGKRFKKQDIDLEAAETILSPLEFRKFKASIELNKVQLIGKYLKKIEDFSSLKQNDKNKKE